MTALGWNLLLALAWCALAGSLTVATMAAGFAVGFFLLWWLAPAPSVQRYVRLLPLLIAFTFFYVYEVVRSSLQVAWDVITPRARRRPAIIVVPLEVETDAEIALLANLITFTPGTVALDVTPDRRFLLLHDLFVDDADRERAAIKRKFERWVLRILR